MKKVQLVCRMATTFTPSQALDEEAFEQFLQRFLDADLGVYIASGGSGEGHALTNRERRRVYEIGVRMCKGKVQVNANPPEQHTVWATVEQAQIAVDAGVEVVNIYGPTMAHGYRPTPGEITAYFDGVASALKAPIAIAPNPVMGYSPSAQVMADIANRHSNVVAINLSGLGNSYFVQLKDALRRDVPVYVPFENSLYTLPLGAAGLLGAEANILPKTFRHYLDLHERGATTELLEVYSGLMRFAALGKAWYGATPRWIKLAMLVLGIPGGEGGLRAPYMMPPAEDIKRFTRELLAVGLPEIDELSAAAGLTADESAA